MNLSALQHSAFLQSLGWAIANSLWQAAIIWSSFYIIRYTHKNASARFKNNLSTGLIFLIFLCFLVTFFQKYLTLRLVPGSVEVIPQVANGYLAKASTFSWTYLLENVIRTLPFLSIAYLILLLILSTRLVNSYLHIFFLKSNGLSKPPAAWRVFTEKVSFTMGLSRKISIWFSAHVDVPATIGFLKPFILIPLASINQLTPNQLEAVILHELSHIKRNDYFINIIINVIETLLFFNPFVALLGSIVKKERENCCDDLVLQFQYDRHSYASALLCLEHTRTTNIPLALAATNGKKQLLLRVKRIMEVKTYNNNFDYGQRILALLMITGIICSIAWLAPEKTGPSFPKVAIFNPILKVPAYPVRRKNKVTLFENALQIKTLTKEIVSTINEEVSKSLRKEDIPAVISTAWDEIADKPEKVFNEFREDKRVSNFRSDRVESDDLLSTNINKKLFKDLEELNLQKSIPNILFNEFNKLSSQQVKLAMEQFKNKLTFKQFENITQNISHSFDTMASANKLQFSDIRDEFFVLRKLFSSLQIRNAGKKLLINNRSQQPIIYKRHQIDSLISPTSEASSDFTNDFFNHKDNASKPKLNYSYQFNPGNMLSNTRKFSRATFRKRPSSLQDTLSTNRGKDIDVKVHGNRIFTKIECRDGIVSLNGQQLNQFIIKSIMPNFTNDIIVVSDGNKLIEININH